MHKIRKRGMSEIISYILILSMAVSLGTFIAVWYRNATEKEVSGVLTPLEGASECDEVNVNVVLDYAGCSLSVYNTGSLAIESMKITYADSSGGFNTTDYDSIKLMPRANTGPIGIPSEGINRATLGNINIIPIVMSGKQAYYCSKGYSFNTNEGFACGQ